MSTYVIQVRDLQDMLLPVDRHRPVEVCVDFGIEDSLYCFIDNVEYSCGRARLICLPDGELKTSREEELDERCDELINAQERLLEMLERFHNVMMVSDPVERSTQLETAHKEVEAELAKEH